MCLLVTWRHQPALNTCIATAVPEEEKYFGKHTLLQSIQK